MYILSRTFTASSQAGQPVAWTSPAFSFSINMIEFHSLEIARSGHVTKAVLYIAADIRLMAFLSRNQQFCIMILQRPDWPEQKSPGSIIISEYCTLLLSMFNHPDCNIEQF
jgi:hypothetical protein